MPENTESSFGSDHTPLRLTLSNAKIDSFLSSLSRMPDAFVCASDYVACILIFAFESGIVLKAEDVAIGFDNTRIFLWQSDYRSGLQ